MQMLPEPEASPLQEHLFICQLCRERLDAESKYVMATGRQVPLRLQKLPRSRLFFFDNLWQLRTLIEKCDPSQHHE